MPRPVPGTKYWVACHLGAAGFLEYDTKNVIYAKTKELHQRLRKVEEGEWLREIEEKTAAVFLWRICLLLACKYVVDACDAHITDFFDLDEIPAAAFIENKVFKKLDFTVY